MKKCLGTLLIKIIYNLTQTFHKKTNQITHRCYLRLRDAHLTFIVLDLSKNEFNTRLENSPINYMVANPTI